MVETPLLFKFKLACWVLLFCFANLYSKNPIVSIEGLNDPHIIFFNNKAYVYASHNQSKDNKGLIINSIEFLK